MSVMKLTPVQAKAIDPNHSVWVGASAGTGKTHILSNRVVRLLLEGARPEKILCLTYTKAAAAEMANRINERLAAWTTADAGLLRDEIASITGSTPDGKQLAVARRLFAEVLDAPGGLKILTLHAFCESLLARFPVEAGISPNATVIDERSTDELLAWCRHQMLDDIRHGAEQHALADALQLFTSRLAEDSFSDLIQALIADRQKLSSLWPEGLDREEALALQRQRLATLFDLDPEEREDAMLEKALSDDVLDVANFRTIAQCMSERGSKTDIARAEKMITVLEQKTAADRIAHWDAWKRVFLTQKDELQKRQVTKAIETAMPGTADRMMAEAERVLVILDRQRARHNMQLTLAALAIGFDQIGRYQAEKDRRAVLDFDDLITKSRALVASDGRGMAHWVQYKLDGGIDHILVDEAQDTSPLQWEIIEALAADMYSGESARSDVGRSLFVVGDSKQSIYSFQGAEPTKFAEWRRFFRQAMQDADKPFESLDLDLSFRSAPAILSLVDKTFDAPHMKKGVALDEGGWIDHHPHRASAGGRVEIWPLFEEAKKAKADAWALPVTYQRGDNAAMRLAREIARTIRNWIQTGHRLPARKKPVSAGDILVLVRRRNDFARDLIRALKDFGIPVAGADRLFVTEHIAVRDLVSLGRFLLLEQDDLSLAETLKSPIFCMNEEKLMQISIGRKKGQSLWAAMKARAGQDKDLARLVSMLEKTLKNAQHLRPFELFAGLLTDLDGRRLIRQRMGDEALDAVEEFLNLALLYGKEHAPTLQGFLAWLDGGNTQIKRDFDATRDEVRVMTVHGSKGLQAPIVFLQDVTGESPDRSKIFWGYGADERVLMLCASSKDQDDLVRRSWRDAAAEERAEEQRRLLYVAMTRAEDHLIVCGHCKDADKIKDSDWYQQIAHGFARLDHVIEEPGPGEGQRQVYENPQQEVITAATRTEARDMVTGLPDFVRVPPADDPAPARPLTPSRPVDEEPAPRSPAKSQDGQYFRRGRAMHILLQFLPDLPASQRQQAAMRYLTAPGQSWPESEAQAMIDEIAAILQDDQWAALFGPGSRAEAPISGLVGNGQYALNGQVDRLLVTDSEVWIVDYKTNRPSAKRLEDVPVAYLRQMAAYRAALREVYQDRQIRCLLLWTEIPALMELPDAMLDQYPPVTG